MPSLHSVSVGDKVRITVGCIVIQGVKLDERGHIVVDEFQNTTRAGVYAVGDVCGRALLTPGMVSGSHAYGELALTCIKIFWVFCLNT